MNIKYKADELEKALDEAMEYCSVNNEPPVDFILHKFTSIDQVTMERYVHAADDMAKGEKPVDQEVMRCAEAIKKWWEFKTVWWLRLGIRNEKLSAFSIFNLKQPCNGGYSDRPLGTVGNVEVVIKADAKDFG